MKKQRPIPEPQEPTPIVCPSCGGLANPMGALGRTLHYRCRDCGIDSYRRAS